MRVQFTKRSKNVKTGPIPVSMTEQASCPDACPLKQLGCYASSGPLSWTWRTVGDNARYSWGAFLMAVAGLPARQLWRHNQAGDLPGVNNRIDPRKLGQLVKANAGKRGFTYTHKPMTDPVNRAAVKSANESGFTINLSADNMREADELAELGIAPVVVVVPTGDVATSYTPQGRKVVCCPAYTHGATCETCGLCQHARRSVIVKFPAHGNYKRQVSAMAAS